MECKCKCKCKCNSYVMWMYSTVYKWFWEVGIAPYNHLSRDITWVYQGHCHSGHRAALCHSGTWGKSALQPWVQSQLSWQKVGIAPILVDVKGSWVSAQFAQSFRSFRKSSEESPIHKFTLNNRAILVHVLIITPLRNAFSQIPGHRRDGLLRWRLFAKKHDESSWRRRSL